MDTFQSSNSQTQVVCQKNSDVPSPFNSLQKFYSGFEREFSFQGRNFVIPKSFDVFNHYRCAFYNLANEMSKQLNIEFASRVHDLDSYLMYFPVMYSHYREPLIRTACNLLIDAGVYDVPIELFRETHTKDFCSCNDDMQVTIDNFRMTIANNQEQIIRGYNMMPGLIFNGLGGFVAAVAVNAAVAGISESQIRNANVSPAQRRELYNQIKISILLEHVFIDYWRVFLSFTWWLWRRGKDVWYPSVENNQKAQGLFQNLCSNRLPIEKSNDVMLEILKASPYNQEYFKYMIWKYGDTEEVSKIRRYYGYHDFNNPRL